MKKDYDSTRIYRNTKKKGASQTYDTPSFFAHYILEWWNKDKSLARKQPNDGVAIPHLSFRRIQGQTA